MSDPAARGPQLERTISLPGAVALVVGGVVGAGIFALVREIGALSGASIWLVFAVAILVSLVGVLPLIQLASAVPLRAGAGYVFASRFLSPFLGVMTSCWVVFGGAASTALVALTLATYLQEYLPVALPNQAVAVAVVLAFYGVYWFGLRLAMSLQVIMAVQFVSALVVYGLAGAWHTPLQFAVVPPHGAPSFFMAVLLAYSTCLGFQVIGEMGEETRNPRRTIPLALVIGGALVAGIYILTGAVFVASMANTPDAYSQLSAPLVESAARFLPAPIVRFIGIGALTAGLTSLNAGAIALPRELLAQARDGIAPELLARVSPRTHGPQHATTAYFVIVVLLLLAGGDIDLYGYLAAIGILAISSVLCVAALRLVRLRPDDYHRAYVRFPVPVLVTCTIITVTASLGFAAVLILECPVVLPIYALWSLLIAAAYALRVRSFTPEHWQRIREIPSDTDSPQATVSPDEQR